MKHVDPALPRARRTARARARGFSLIELIMVVAVIAVLGAIAVYSIQRSRENATVERAASTLRMRIERAQALAAVAGSRMATPRLVLGAGCPNANPSYLWVQVDAPANRAIFPAALDYNAATDVMTVTCENWQLTQVTNGLGVFEFPAAQTTFAFTSDGRVVMSDGTTGSVYVGIRHAVQPRRFGVRVLASGVVCPSGRPATVGCDEDT